MSVIMGEVGRKSIPKKRSLAFWKITQDQILSSSPLSPSSEPADAVDPIVNKAYAKALGTGWVSPIILFSPFHCQVTSGLLLAPK